jgi:acetyl esterase/lipase
MNAKMDIPYGRDHSDARRMDLFQPDGARNGCAMFMVHGGGWTGGSRAQWNRLAEHFTGQGYVFASVTYRLVPAAVFPAQIEDVRLAMSFLRTQAADLGFHSTRIAAMGSSAGGHLVALLSTIGPDDPLGAGEELAVRDTRPNATVCYCAVLSMHDRDNLPSLVECRTKFMSGTESEKPDAYCDASPIDRVNGAEPPFLFVHGDADDTVPVQQSLAMHQKLADARVESHAVVLPGVGHGFGYGAETDPQKRSLELVRRFLANRFDLP